MRVRIIGYGAVLANESSFELDYLRMYLKHNKIPHTETKNREDQVLIYVQEDHISRLPKNKFGTYLPISETDGPGIYEIYNIDTR